MQSTFLVLAIIGFIYLLKGGSAQQCFDDDASFSNNCETNSAVKYPVTIGDRCYFTVNEPPSSDFHWSTGWTLCADAGGTLAQIHSHVEFDRLITFLNSALPVAPDLWVGFWLGLKRNSSTVSGLNPESYWYGSENHQLIPMKDTWFRYIEVNQSTDISMDECIALQRVNMKWIFGGIPCATGVVYPLCYFTNPSQSFRRMNNLCIAENPIEELQNQYSAEDCMSVCVQRDWCRSFNYRKNAPTKSCQLFNWLLADQVSVVTGDTDCELYIN